MFLRYAAYLRHAHNAPEKLRPVAPFTEVDMPLKAAVAGRPGGCRKPALILLGLAVLVALVIFKGLVLLFGALIHHKSKYGFDVTGEWSARPSRTESITLDLSLDSEGKLHGYVQPCRANRFMGATDPKLTIFTDRSSWNGQDLHLEGADEANSAAVDAGVQGSKLFGSYSWFVSGQPTVTHTVTFTRGGAFCN